MIQYKINGKWYTAIPVEDDICHDCGALKGMPHSDGCDDERDPRDGVSQWWGEEYEEYRSSFRGYRGQVEMLWREDMFAFDELFVFDINKKYPEGHPYGASIRAAIRGHDHLSLQDRINDAKVHQRPHTYLEIFKEAEEVDKLFNEKWNHISFEEQNILMKDLIVPFTHKIQLLKRRAENDLLERNRVREEEFKKYFLKMEPEKQQEFINNYPKWKQKCEDLLESAKQSDAKINKQSIKN